MQHDHAEEVWVLGMFGLFVKTRISKASSTDRERNNQATPMAKAQTIRKNWKLKCSCTPMPLVQEKSWKNTREKPNPLPCPCTSFLRCCSFLAGLQVLCTSIMRTISCRVFWVGIHKKTVQLPCLPQVSSADSYQGAKAHVPPQSHFASAYAPPTENVSNGFELNMFFGHRPEIVSKPFLKYSF